MTKRYDFRFPPEVGEALDMVGHRNRTGWTAAAIMGTMAMARAAARVLHSLDEWAEDGDAADHFGLAEDFARRYPGHTALTVLVGDPLGRKNGPQSDARDKLDLFAKLRDIDLFPGDIASAVLVMAWVRNVDPGLFSRMAAGDG